jgi:hypothetical protein
MPCQVVKAVDVGYGNTKYTVLVAVGNTQCGAFPPTPNFISSDLKFFT